MICTVYTFACVTTSGCKGCEVINGPCLTGTSRALQEAFAGWDHTVQLTVGPCWGALYHLDIKKSPRKLQKPSQTSKFQGLMSSPTPGPPWPRKHLLEGDLHQHGARGHWVSPSLLVPEESQQWHGFNIDPGHKIATTLVWSAYNCPCAFPCGVTAEFQRWYDHINISISYGASTITVSL